MSRLFRHSSIYIRTDRGIKTPADLKGKTIGLPEYQMTANVWVRGMLQEEYGVKPRDIKWRRGGLEEPGREERAKITLPPEIDLQAGAGRPHDLRHAGEGRDRRPAQRAGAELLPARRAERRRGCFRTIRRWKRRISRRPSCFRSCTRSASAARIVEKYPWVAVNVYKAFLKAKALCMHELGQIGHLHATLPWPVYAYDHARKVMGEDYWPYGAHENKLPLETLARYSFEQGLSVRQVPLDEMFAKPTYELTKI